MKKNILIWFHLAILTAMVVHIGVDMHILSQHPEWSGLPAWFAVVDAIFYLPVIAAVDIFALIRKKRKG